MPYVNKSRPYKHEYQLQKERGDIAGKLERQRARRAIDKNEPDTNANGKADRREGKDVAHHKPISKGGSNKDGFSIEASATNRSFRRNSKSALVSEKSKREIK
jgi:hypothetical protein